MTDQNQFVMAGDKMIYRHLKEIVKYLAILAIGLFVLMGIHLLFSPGTYRTIKSVFLYRSQTANLDKVQSLQVYFDQQFKRDIPSEEISAYAHEIHDVALSEITWDTACPFTIKLVFTFQDKHIQSVLIGTDGCGQIQLPNGLQGKFPFKGKLAKLEEEYYASQDKSNAFLQPIVIN
jgi:hypothetical protein